MTMELSGLKDVKELNRRVMVALDVDSREQALELANVLRGSGCWLKVGLELYCHYGQPMLKELQKMEFPIFLDLKLHDIPNTVERTVRVLAETGVDIMNVHCGGGYEMMARAAQAAGEVSVRTGRDIKVIGVTVLTSMDEAQLHQEIGVMRTLPEQVVSLARLAKQAGLAGVVSSAQEVISLRREFGSEFLLVTPGIRPASAARQDQVRVCTPREAIEAGSSFLVVGRPVTQAENPRKALDSLWD